MTHNSNMPIIARPIYSQKIIESRQTYDLLLTLYDTKNFNDVGSVNGAHGDWRRCWWQSGLMWGAKKARRMLPACLGGVVLPRFELGQAEPKSAVLPLHHKTISVPKSFPLSAPQSYYFFLKRQNILAQKIKLSPKTFACQIF